MAAFTTRSMPRMWSPLRKAHRRHAGHGRKYELYPCSSDSDISSGKLEPCDHREPSAESMNMYTKRSVALVFTACLIACKGERRAESAAGGGGRHLHGDTL